jgi:hypothetical protein
MKIRFALDNHPVHICISISQKQSERFEFAHASNHGSWLNFIWISFGKIAGILLLYLEVFTKNDLLQKHGKNWTRTDINGNSAS